MSKLAFILGAPKDPSAGLVLHKKLQDFVKEDDDLITIYTNSELKLKYALVFAKENEIYRI